MALNYTPAFMTPNPYGMSVAPPRQSTPQASGPMSYYGPTQYPVSTQRGIMGPQSGSVLGTGTQTNNNPGSTFTLNGPVDTGPAPTQNNDVLNKIGSGWDSYISELDGMLNNDLSTQRQLQENIAQNAYNTGVSQLGSQKTNQINEVESNKSASLKDLSSNITNLFQAGNNYLGARGASDSSAANQYAYAVTKMGTKERGNINSDATKRMQQIGDIYNNQVNLLGSELEQKKMQAAQWFSESQSALKQQIAQGKLSRSQDIANASQNLYNQALVFMQQEKQKNDTRKQALENWALSKSNDVQTYTRYMQEISGSMPRFQGIQGGMPQVNTEGQMYVPGNYLGNSKSQETDIFGNPVR